MGAPTASSATARSCSPRRSAASAATTRAIGAVRTDRHRELWARLFELERYVCSHEMVIPNYHRRQWAGLRVSTALAESAVNSVVNQRMNKRAADALLGGRRAIAAARVRTAVINGERERLEPAHAATAANEPVATALAA